MGILSVYDTVGIQNYIFASNKLAENVGGSKLVADIFATILPGVIKKIAAPNLPDWRNGGPLDSALKAEIVYQGGGNAYVKFANEDMLNKVTEEFLTQVSLDAPGVGIAVAAIETDFVDYKSDFEKLNKRLTLVKGSFNIPVFAGNQPITKQSGRTGLPVDNHDDDNEYLSTGQRKKRDKYRIYKKDKNIQSIDFDDLAFEKGNDSLIAVVHADGNNMGKRIKTFMEHTTPYSEAVPKIRALATAIDRCYEAARANTIGEFKTAYAAYIAELRKKYPGKYDNTKDKNFDAFPLLELISDGDDITIVICGRFALDFTAKLLREIEKQADPFGEGKNPTACAGVVLFHSHYPFSEAYKLAEALCGSAKKPARDCEGSYMDFHLHRSGNVAGLEQLRERQYTVDKKTILRRPWRVSCGGEAYPNFKWFEDNIVTVADAEKLPRNKTKAIRNAIGAGDEAAKLIINQLRGVELPNLPKDKEGKIDMSDFAAAFDILELCDAYVNLLNKAEGEKFDNQ